jgi:adenylate kinase
LSSQFRQLHGVPEPRSFSATSVTYAAYSDEEKHVAALILGKPGGGKGTISGKILRDFPDFYHLSTGDILRQHVRAGTKLGKEAKAHMNAGYLVPDDLMIRLVMDEAHGHEDRSLLLDGFPRTMEQAEALEKKMHVDFVINLDIPTETIVDRISDRWIHAPSGRVYSYSYKPPKVEGLDDETGEPLIQRADDQPDKVRKRMEAYDEITAPLVDYYQQQGVLTTFSGTMSDVIYVDVKQFLADKFKNEERA